MPIRARLWLPVLSLGVALGLTSCAATGEAPALEQEEDVVIQAMRRIDRASPRVKPVWRESGRDTPAIRLTTSDGAALKLAALSAEVILEDPVAVTELHLVFENPEARERDGRFSIQLPRDVEFARFAIKEDGHWRDANALDLRNILDTYESYLHREAPLDPALLEADVESSFSAPVFSIAAKSTKEITIAYSERQASSTYRLQLGGLPTVPDLSVKVWVDPNPLPAPQPRQFRLVAPELTLEGASELGSGRDLEVELVGQPEIVAVAADEYAVVRYRADYLPKVDPIEDLVILVDTSQSMAAQLEPTLQALEELAHELSRAPRFNLRILAFDQTVEELYAGPSGGDLSEVFERLRARGALGASDLAVALATLAVDTRCPSRMLVVSDGVETAGGRRASTLAEVDRLTERGLRRIDAVAPKGTADLDRLRALSVASIDAGTLVLPGTSARAARETLQQAPLAAQPIVVEGAEFVSPPTLAGVASGEDVILHVQFRNARPRPVRLRFPGTGLPSVEVEPEPADAAVLNQLVVGARIDAIERRLDEYPPEHPHRAYLRERLVHFATNHRIPSKHTALQVATSPHVFFGRDPVGPLLVGSGTVSRLGGEGRAADYRYPEALSPVFDAAPPPRWLQDIGFQAGWITRNELEAAHRELREGVVRLDLAGGDGLGRQVGLVGGKPKEPRVIAALRFDTSSTSLSPAFIERLTAAAQNYRDARAIAIAAAELEHTPPPALPSRRMRSPAPRSGGRSPKRARQAVAPYEGPYELVQKLLDQGRVEDAVAFAEAWHSAEPGSVIALLTLGDLLTRNGEHDRASRLYGSLIDLFPSRADVLRLAAARLAQLGPHSRETAIFAVSEAIERQPEEASSYQLAAWIHLRNGSPMLAFEILERGLALPLTERSARARAGLHAELETVGAIWLAQDPEAADEIHARLAAMGGVAEAQPRTRVTVHWETDASDVDLHVDAPGLEPGQQRTLVDIVDGYGPEVWQAVAIPERIGIRVHYFDRGAVGYAGAVAHTIVHDGSGGYWQQSQPFVLMRDRGWVPLEPLELPTALGVSREETPR